MNYNTIKFNDVYLANYYGLKNLGLSPDWEDTYNKLVLDNSLTNVVSGYIFINNNTHFIQNWRKVNSLGLENLSFWENFKNTFLLWRNYRSGFANTWTDFCGFFQIEKYNNIQMNKIEYRLHFTDISYSDSIKLPVGDYVELVEKQVVSTDDDFIHFPRSIIPFSEKKSEYISRYLYFPINDFIDMDGKSETNFIKADIVFSEGKQIEINEASSLVTNDNSTEYETSENIKDSDAVIISALFNALELENPDDFSGNDKLVVNHLNKLHPNQSYLTHSTISKRLAIGRGILGISKKQKST